MTTNWWRVTIVMVLIAVVTILLVLKSRSSETSETLVSEDKTQTIDMVSSTPSDSDKETALPKLVDLGAGTCIPCKMMEPILDELKETYADRLEVVFIDVREHPWMAQRYGIRVIPTQIFYDRQGEEIFRHEGFFSKEDILKTLEDAGLL